MLLSLSKIRISYMELKHAIRFVIDHAYLFVPDVSPYYQNTRARSAILFHFNAVRDVTSLRYIANLFIKINVQRNC